MIKPFIYVGMTDNFQRRFNEHNAGKGRSSKPYAPFTLVYIEDWPDRPTARIREKYLKSTAGKNFLRKNMGLAF